MAYANSESYYWIVLIGSMILVTIETTIIIVYLHGLNKSLPQQPKQNKTALFIQTSTMSVFIFYDLTMITGVLSLFTPFFNYPLACATSMKISVELESPPPFPLE